MPPRPALVCLLALLGAGAAGTHAQAEDADRFVEANLISIFYHELGHAIIDTEAVPIFGQEEDAADVFSILLIDTLFEEDTALDLAYDASFGFLGEAILRGENGEEPAWWDTHGPDEQRFYNTVCLFYGANPDSRDDFASDFDLPEDRAEYCPDEYDQAFAAWGTVLEDLTSQQGATLTYRGGTDSLTADVIRAEISDLNQDFRFSAPLTVVFESCGEPNAFYDPDRREIIMCDEFEDHLYGLFDRL